MQQVFTLTTMQQSAYTCLMEASTIDYETNQAGQEALKDFESTLKRLGYEIIEKNSKRVVGEKGGRISGAQLAQRNHIVVKGHQ